MEAGNTGADASRVGATILRVGRAALRRATEDVDFGVAAPTIRGGKTVACGRRTRGEHENGDDRDGGTDVSLMHDDLHGKASRWREARRRCLWNAATAIAPRAGSIPSWVGMSAPALRPHAHRSRAGLRVLQRRRTHSVANRCLVVIACVHLSWWLAIEPTGRSNAEMNTDSALSASSGDCGGRVVPIGSRGRSGKGASGFTQQLHRTGATPG